MWIAAKVTPSGNVAGCWSNEGDETLSISNADADDISERGGSYTFHRHDLDAIINLLTDAKAAIRQGEIDMAPCRNTVEDK